MHEIVLQIYPIMTHAIVIMCSMRLIVQGKLHSCICFIRKELQLYNLIVTAVH